MLALLVALVSSCSLLGLDDFEIASCITQTDCEPVNAERGIAADACEQYWCRRGECRLGRGERCDGLDNDCNDVVDDLDATRDTLRDEQVVAVGEPNRLALTLEPSAPMDFLLTWSDAAGVSRLHFGEEVPSAMTHAVSSGCAAATEPGSRVDEVSLAGPMGLGDTSGLAASLGTTGCGGGRMLLSWRSGDDLLIVGNETRSTSFLGVACGASAPIAARLGEDDPRALVAWSTRPATEPEACVTATPAAVAVLGAWFEAAGGVQWITTTGSGAPELLGETVAHGRPAIAGWPEGDGWILAHAPAAGGVEVRAVAGYLTGPMPMCVEGGVPRTSDPLAIGAPVAIPGEGAIARRVAIAAGRAPDASAAAVVVWQRGCGEDASIWAATVRRAGTEPVAGDPVRLSAGPPATRPAVTWTAAGPMVAWIAAADGMPGEVRGRRVALEGDRATASGPELGLSPDATSLEAVVWGAPSGETWLARASTNEIALGRVACLP